MNTDVLYNVNLKQEPPYGPLITRLQASIKNKYFPFIFVWAKDIHDVEIHLGHIIHCNISTANFAFRYTS